MIRGFVLVDQTTGGRVSVAMLAAWASHAEAYVREDVALAWDRAPVPVRVGEPASAQPGECVLYGVDRDADVPGALAYHSENAAGAYFGKWLVETILENGGSLTDGAESVVAALLHEVAEARIDEACNLWADAGDGRSVAVEVCDPVQDKAYTAGACDLPRPNFVMPAWFDALAPAGAPLDRMGSLAAPFTRTAGGYFVERQDGVERQVFGEAVAPWRRDLAASVSRRARASR